MLDYQLHLVEIGCVGISSLHYLLTPYARLDIIEPLQSNLNAILMAYNGLPNVNIFPYAIWKEDGKVNLFPNGLSTFVEGVDSPAIINDGFDCKNSEKVEVEARTFDHFDDGTIDFLDIDMEGAEWFAIQHLKSRPHVISVEMGWKKYRNPYYDNILEWMKENGYKEIAKPNANMVFKRI